jgi:SAM-dependent methyltransferase
MADIADNRLNEQNSYDEIPYDSHSYFHTYPDHLRTLGVLFGMNPKAADSARVLELGCASGGNLIPMAYYLPKAKFIGIDNSVKQIDLAKQDVSQLNLTNIEFQCKSILNLDSKSLGKFDYIIVHGMFSWIDEQVRQKILDITRDCLAEQGIAYISYNTLPGWNMVKSIRDMMKYHGNFFNDTREKINQGKMFLNFVKNSLDGENSPYSNFLKQEIGIISNQSDAYLRHDHLETINQPYYFCDFMAQANNSGLQYLADANLPSMFLGNMPAKVAQQLSTVKDIVRLEQHMDFIYNRRFRATLLCKGGIKLNRNLSMDNIKQFYLSCKIAPEKLLKDILAAL